MSLIFSDVKPRTWRRRRRGGVWKCFQRLRETSSSTRRLSSTATHTLAISSGWIVSSSRENRWMWEKGCWVVVAGGASWLCSPNNNYKVRYVANLVTNLLLESPAKAAVVPAAFHQL